jgi:hypothetical protein
MLVSGLFIADIITRLGDPVYFLTILGVWKVAASIVTATRKQTWNLPALTRCAP